MGADRVYRLFHEFAHRYDLHTPPGHYKKDHAFVIGEALRVAPSNCRLLDVGCGTGVFLEAALAAGIDGYGIDSAPEMVTVAQGRLGNDRVTARRMQDITTENAYSVICALSWSIHYCETEAELGDVLMRCRRALKDRGILVLQVANDAMMSGAVNIDRERGPAGEPDDTYFIHRFRALQHDERCAVADYIYISRAHRELVFEQHHLQFTNPSMVARTLLHFGFAEVRMVNPESISPFIIATHISPLLQTVEGVAVDISKK